MAFASMMFVYIILICIILGVLFIAGLALLIIGLVNKRKLKYRGKKSPVVCIITGAVLLAAPIIVTIIVLAAGFSSVISNLNTDYDNVTDKWRYSRVYDNEAAEGAIQQLLEAAESNDQKAFIETFTPNIQNNESFKATLDKFFSLYPKGLAMCELDGGTTGSSGSYNYGHNIETGRASYTCILDGEWYYIGMNFCFRNTDYPDEVGVNFFCIENLEAYALDNKYVGSDYLICSIIGEDEITARLIDGRGYIFEPTPERIITEAELCGYLDECYSLSDLTLIIGEPNVKKKYDNHTGYDYYYELASENGEPRYAYICTSTNMKLLYGYVCSDTEAFHDRPLRFDKT